jgi:hypothetical protein
MHIVSYFFSKRNWNALTPDTGVHEGEREWERRKVGKKRLHICRTRMKSEEEEEKVGKNR